MSPAIGPLQAAGFLLAGYAVMGNDSLQTLGPYLAGNRGRIPKALQALYLCSLLCLVLLLGWHRGQGDPAWGRLSTFALPGHFSWVDLLPPLTVLTLTRWGAPVSTSFLVLTAFSPANLPALLRRSFTGYGVALVLAGILYAGVGWLLEQRVRDEPLAEPAPASPTAAPDTPTAPPSTSEAPCGDRSPGRPHAVEPRPPADPSAHPLEQPLWMALQWAATGWLWGQWLVQDLANIYVYLPRRLTGPEMALSLTVLCAGVCLLIRENGGAVQRVLTGKTHGDDPRSGTLIAALYGCILFGCARVSTVPMSTTWVFLGLLAGRELALQARLHPGPPVAVARELGMDLLKAGLGLGVSVAVALAVQPWRHGG